MLIQNNRQNELNARKFSLFVHHCIQVINHDNFSCMKVKLVNKIFALAWFS